MKNTLKRFICFTLLLVLGISGNVYADSSEIQIGTDVYNLVTTFVGDAGTMRGFAWSANTDYANMTISYLGSSQVDEIKLFFWDYTSTIPSVEPVIIY